MDTNPNQPSGNQPVPPAPTGAAGPEPNPQSTPQPTQPTPQATAQPAAQAATQPTQPAQPAMQPINPTTPSAPKSNKNLFIIIGAAVIVVLIIAIVAIVAITGNKSNDQGNSGNQNQGSSNEDKPGNDSNDNKDDDNSQFVSPNVGGTLTVGRASITYSDRWEEEPSTDKDTKTIYADNDEEAFILALIESDKGLTLDEYAEGMVDVYESEGLELREKLSSQTINGIDWQHARMRDDEAVYDFWFYAQGEQYYMLTLANTGTFTIISYEAQAIIDSLTIK